VNVGGAVIPALLSIYLLSKNRLWGRGLIAIACVATICHAFAQPVRGVGPPFVAAITAAIVSWRNAAPLARWCSGAIRPMCPRRATERRVLCR
jgi:uncharacterized membrane protein